MALVRPAEVHPEEHLGPVGRLGAAGAGADRDERRSGVVLAVEQQLRPFPGEVPLQRRPVRVELGAQLGVVGLAEELGRRLEIVGATDEVGPAIDLGPQVRGFRQDLRRASLVVPEAGRARQAFELREASLLRGEVKDAPRSTGSAPPGRGRPQRPSVSALEVLEQDRTELDESEGRLAPGDDGVHARTIAVVGADTAVAVTVEGGGVAAGPAVSFAGDEIDECRFLGLLHESLPERGGARRRQWRGHMTLSSPITGDRLGNLRRV
jgi:hypothetical protein